MSMDQGAAGSNTTYTGGALSMTYTTGTDLASATSGTGVPLNGIPTTLTSTGRRIRFCLAVSAAAQMFVRVGGNNILLNDGVPLPVDTAYELGVDLPIGTVYTIRFGTSCTVRWLTIKELN